MFENTKAFSGYSVDDIDAAKKFYGETLGIKVNELDPENGLLELEFPGDRNVLVYAGANHEAGSATLLNFPVDDIDKAVDQMIERGVEFERYEGFDQDEKGIARGQGPNIAWFKDPAGNVLSVLDG